MLPPPVLTATGLSLFPADIFYCGGFLIGRRNCHNSAQVACVKPVQHKATAHRSSVKVAPASARVCPLTIGYWLITCPHGGN